MQFVGKHTPLSNVAVVPLAVRNPVWQAYPTRQSSGPVH